MRKFSPGRWLWLLGLFAVAARCAAQTDCVFCRIAAREVPAVEVCREGDVMAFMDRAPRNPGHVLVIPVAHAENLLTVPPRTLERIATLAQRIAQAIRAAGLPAAGIQVQMNSGRAAGQSVFHAHLHVIPRHAGEAASAGEGKAIAPTSELEAVAARIRAQLLPAT